MNFHLCRRLGRLILCLGWLAAVGIGCAAQNPPVITAPVAPPAPMNRLYVATNGNDATAVRGDANYPWRTFGLAVSNAMAGDVIHVGPGQFAEPNTVALPQHVSIQGDPDAELVLGGGDGGFDGALVVANDSTIQGIGLSLTNAYAWILVGDPYGDDQPGTNIVFRQCRLRGRSDVFMVLFGIQERGVPYSLTVESCDVLTGWDLLAGLYWSSTNASITMRDCDVKFDTREQRDGTNPSNGNSNGLMVFAEVEGGGRVEFSGLSVHVVYATNMLAYAVRPDASAKLQVVMRNLTYDLSPEVTSRVPPGKLSTPADFLRSWQHEHSTLLMESVSWSSNGVWRTIGSAPVSARAFVGDGSQLTNLPPAALPAGVVTNGADATLSGLSTPYLASENGTVTVVGHLDVTGGNLTTDQAVIAYSFHGIGVGLSNLLAGEIVGAFPGLTSSNGNATFLLRSNSVSGPGQRFTVADPRGGSPWLVVSNGAVGIRTASPTASLDVAGSIHASGDLTGQARVSVGADSFLAWGDRARLYSPTAQTVEVRDAAGHPARLGADSVTLNSGPSVLLTNGTAAASVLGAVLAVGGLADTCFTNCPPGSAQQIGVCQVAGVPPGQAAPVLGYGIGYVLVGTSYGSVTRGNWLSVSATEPGRADIGATLNPNTRDLGLGYALESRVFTPGTANLVKAMLRLGH